jgi:Zn-dependent protease with chaperone function
VLLTSFLLAGLAIVLAWPVPSVLARAAWPARAPGTALLVWQAIALAGGLSMIGAMLTYGLVPFGDHLVAGLTAFVGSLADGRLPESANFTQMFALSGAILLGLHLVLNLALTSARTERQRRRHVQLVRLLSFPMPGSPSTRLIDHAAPIAYCLPQSFRSMTVLSAGLLELLDEEQLRAVIAHEEAHVRQRHHIVLLGFAAWRSALPWFPIAVRAQDAVALLVEMLADDRARQAVSDGVLAGTVVLTATGGVDDESRSTGLADPLAIDTAPTSPAVTGLSTAALIEPRVRRLVSPRPPLAAAARFAIAVCAVALVAVPTVLLFLPALIN